MGVVTIKKGREKPILQQHPWVFSGAIERAQDASPGDIVTVVSHDGSFLARGYWNPKSQIQVRILTWRDEPIDEDWWRRMLRRAIEQRYPHPQYGVGNRIINAESDYIPGLIVDRYDDFLVLQALTLHIDQHKVEIARQLVQLFQEIQMPIRGVYERSDVDVRGKEGLPPTVGLLYGEEPPDLINFGVEALRRLVDARNGHKTGFYLDQVENHNVLSNLTDRVDGPGARMLNLFSYTGGFGILSFIPVVNIDASYEALELAEKTYQLNNWPMDEVEFIQADAFEYLHDAVDRGEQFDVIVCDPPKFAHNAQQVDRAARGYKDLNLNCFKLIKSGGYLMTFSCSGAISADLFQKIVFGALADSGRQAQILKHLGPGDDHPVALTFPEGAYLKGLLLRVY